jgi:hypothetical protein
MKSQSLCLLASLAAILLLGACQQEEKHPGADALAQVIQEEIKAYQAAKKDCTTSQTRLTIFYRDEGWHKRTAQASVDVIQNNFDKDEEFIWDSARIIKKVSKRLDDASFEFKATCRGNLDYLVNLKKNAGIEIKKKMDIIDVGAVSRLYDLDVQLRPYIKDSYQIRDKLVEARLESLKQHRIEKEVEATLGKSITGD